MAVFTASAVLTRLNNLIASLRVPPYLAHSLIKLAIGSCSSSVQSFQKLAGLHQQTLQTLVGFIPPIVWKCAYGKPLAIDITSLRAHLLPHNRLLASTGTETLAVALREEEEIIRNELGAWPSALVGVFFGLGRPFFFWGRLCRWHNWRGLVGLMIPRYAVTAR